MSATPYTICSPRRLQGSIPWRNSPWICTGPGIMPPTKYGDCSIPNCGRALIPAGSSCRQPRATRYSRVPFAGPATGAIAPLISFPQCGDTSFHRQFTAWRPALARLVQGKTGIIRELGIPFTQLRLRRVALVAPRRLPHYKIRWSAESRGYRLYGIRRDELGDRIGQSQIAELKTFIVVLSWRRGSGSNPFPLRIPRKLLIPKLAEFAA